MDEDTLKLVPNNMTARVIDIQEEERKRISRNLHDDLGQNLYSHLITINLLQSQVDHPLVEQIRLEATQLIEQVRKISWEIRPAVLDDLGLLPAIRSYISRFHDYYQIFIHFETNLNRPLGNTIELAIYRIVQEALTNIRKYAHVKEAWLTITERNENVQVIIEDFGQGFNIEQQIKGVGMFSMEERARAIGAQFKCQTKIGQGTKIIVDIPL